MAELALLAAALLFGGMALYAFGFAAFVFSALPEDTAGPLIRRAFPKFYLFVLAISGLGAAVSMAVDGVASAVLAAIAVTTIFARQVLMPAINDATDRGAKRRFHVLHGSSVAITLAHIAGGGFALVRLAAAV